MSGDGKRFGLNGLWLVLLWGLCAGCSATNPALASPPHSRRLIVSVSEEDIENRHPEVVRITTFLDGGAKGRCTGTLIGPRLVLTAGHCVCKPRPDTAGGILIDSSACAKTAVVKTVIYRPKQGVVGDAPSQSEVYPGIVRPHPRLQIRINKQGEMSGKADLAVIFLNEAVGNEIQPARLIDTEVAVGESIVMVGYGLDARLRGSQGERRSGRNDVATFTLGGATFFAGKPPKVVQPVMPGGPIMAQQEGSHMLDGDSGGPCFQESTGALVGIATTNSEPPVEFSEFTSAYHHRKWLNAELARAR